MSQDKSRVDFVFQIFHTCGKKDPVVRVAAAKPMSSFDIQYSVGAGLTALVAIGKRNSARLIPAFARTHLLTGQSRFREFDLFAHARGRGAAYVRARGDRAFEC